MRYAALTVINNSLKNWRLSLFMNDTIIQMAFLCCGTDRGL